MKKQPGLVEKVRAVFLLLCNYYHFHVTLCKLLDNHPREFFNRSDQHIFKVCAYFPHPFSNCIQ